MATEGQKLRVTHAGTITDSLLLTDIDLDPKVPGRGVYVPRWSNPPTNSIAGYVDLVYAGDVAKSFESGAIRGHITAGRVTVSFETGETLGTEQINTMRYSWVVTANAAVVDTSWSPSDITVTGFKAHCTGAPTSAGGTYLLTATVGGNNLFAAANFDLETLVAGTVTNIPLTATTANLDLEADDKIVITATSNNADLTGGAGLSFQLNYRNR